MAPLATETIDDYMEVAGVNQVGTFLGIQGAISAVRLAEERSIVNVGSTADVVASPGRVIAYAASKLAVRGMSPPAAIELGPYRIRVNCFVPV